MLRDLGGRFGCRTSCGPSTYTASLHGGGSRGGNFNGMSCNTLHANRRKGFTHTFRNSAVLQLPCLFNFECLICEYKFGESLPPTSLGPPASRNISSPFPPPPPPPQKPLIIATLHSLSLSPLAWAFDSPTTDGDDAIEWRPHFSRTRRKKRIPPPSHVLSPAKIAGRSDRGIFSSFYISAFPRYLAWKKTSHVELIPLSSPHPSFPEPDVARPKKILLS